MTIQDTFKTSLWMHTAVPAPDTKKLNINCSTEVVIVGAGFTGLSAALHLSEMGCKVTVLEAEEIGFGASGRNGGQVNPGLKIDPDVLLNRFGAKKASHIFSATESSADFVFDLVKRYNLNCELKRTGFIYASENKNMLNKSRLRVEWLKKIGVKAKLLDANETAERIGHQIYSGSIYDPRGGALNPLSYVRELASAALTKGVKIHSNSAALSLKKTGDSWKISTKEGTIIADKVILCTNAYTNLVSGNSLWPNLARSIIPLYSFQVATKPLGDNLRKVILPGGHTVSNTRRLMLYYRFDEKGRFVLGGRGSGQDRTDFRKYEHLVHKVGELFPALKNHEIEFCWGGKVAITTDAIPHLHNPIKGIYAGLGFNGRGVAMSTLLGKWLAMAATGSLPNEALPFTEINPIPFHSFRGIGVSLVTQFKAIQDRLKL
jgi:hypothetical protein